MKKHPAGTTRTGLIKFLILVVSAVAVLTLLHGLTPGWLSKAAPSEIIRELESLVSRYGYWAIFIGALIEATLFVSWYFPGSTIVLVGALLAGRGALSLSIVIITASAGFVTGYIVDFILGRHGWAQLAKYVGLTRSLRKMEERVAGARPYSFALLFGHPHCAVLAATAAGILRQPAYRVLPLMCGAAIIWTTIWAAMAFMFGKLVLESINGPAAILAVIGLTSILIFRR